MICLFCTASLWAQNRIKGKIIDETKEPIPGATVVIEGTLIGTTSDFDGNFEISTSQEYLITLKISFIGFASQTVVAKNSDELLIELIEETEGLDEIVVTAASRFEEKITESPVTIEKIKLTELRTTPSYDMYSAVGNLKGVQSNTGSLTFTSLNTRGFADMQNFRFVQLLDGVYANAPGLGYPLGGNSGPADIDIQSIELVPGASSALYGANAFNGILSIKTKNPFYQQGLSAYYKTGVTVQDAGGTNALNDFGVRYAKAYNDKFAFKINLGYLNGTDWTANDESFYISNTIATTQSDETIANLLATPRNDPNFNAVNVYGDEVQASVDLMGNGTLTPINRTGIKESDIIDYNTQIIKMDAALYYRFSDKLEASYGYRFIQSDGILRHTTVYPLRNLTQTFHRLELKGLNWNLRGFHSAEDTGDSYAMVVTGAFIEQGRKSNTDWANDYGAAFRGEVSGVAAANHDAARVYADRDLPAVGSETFNALRAATLSNPDISTGGSKFIDNTTLTGASFDYNFESFKNIVDLQVGANLRSFRLKSEGQVFNDGPQGFNDDIPVEEYGAFVQLGKKILNERVNLRASIRGDKHSQFDLVYTPRISAVIGLDKERKHNLRMSYQTGFRNPSPQEGYVHVDIGNALIIGGFEDNFDNFRVTTAMGTVIDGRTVYNNLVTIASFQAYAASGFSDPDLLVRANLNFLKQENNSSWEIGYKGVIGNKLLIDANYYHIDHRDLVVRVTTYSPDAGKAYLVYTNVDKVVTSDGFGLGLEYILGNGYRAGFNYTWTQFDAREAVASNPGFLPSFNTPRHRMNFSLTGNNVANTNIGFDLKYKYWTQYQWQSPFGQADVPSAGIVDLALNYKWTKLKTMLKMGASNLLNNEYRLVYGGPQIGSIFYVGWTFDPVFGR
jgi:outer membrane cobalamin receptor